MRILVTYASRHGATKGIAERVAATLEADGLDVKLSEVGSVTTVDDVDACVVGASAYMFHWEKPAAAFVRRHRDELAALPTWLFSSGPLGTEPLDAKGRDQREASRPPEFAEFDEAIRPRDQHVFFGAYDPDAAPAGLAERFVKLMPAVRSALPVGDFRDWPEIEAWAHAIARDLRN